MMKIHRRRLSLIPILLINLSMKHCFIKDMLGFMVIDYMLDCSNYPPFYWNIGWKKCPFIAKI